MVIIKLIRKKNYYLTNPKIKYTYLNNNEKKIYFKDTLSRHSEESNSLTGEASPRRYEYFRLLR